MIASARFACQQALSFLVRRRRAALFGTSVLGCILPRSRSCLRRLLAFHGLVHVPAPLPLLVGLSSGIAITSVRLSLVQTVDICCSLGSLRLSLVEVPGLCIGVKEVLGLAHVTDLDFLSTGVVSSPSRTALIRRTFCRLHFLSYLKCSIHLL